MSFYHVNSLPPEYRPSKLKKQNISVSSGEHNINDSNEESAFNPNEERISLNQEWRMFSRYQIGHANEYYESKLALRGGVEVFNNRPPELRIFDSIPIFTKCIKVTGKRSSKHVLGSDLEHSHFINAMGYAHKFISCSLLIALDHISRKDENQHESKNVLMSLLQQLISNSNESLRKRFVVETDAVSHIPVFSNPHPKNKFKFLYHLLVKYVIFECENKLFDGLSMKSVFIVSNLFEEKHPQESLHLLLKKLILTEFTFLPINAKKFSTYVVIAKKSLKDFLINGTLEFSSVSISESFLKEKASDAIVTFINEKRRDY